MAYTQLANFSLTVVDELGTEAADTFYASLDVTQPISALTTAWNSLAQTIDAVTAGQITKGHVQILMNPAAVSGPSLKTSPVAGSRVEQTGIFNFSNAVTTHRWGGIVPALNSTKIVSGKINLVDTAVAALITFLTTVLTVAQWVTNNQQQLTALRDALISFRKRRKQLSRSSIEI